MTIEDSSLFSEAFRERIREAKKKSGLTLDQLAEDSGVSKTTVIRLMSNGKVDLKLNDCVALCQFFDLSIDEAFGLRVPAPAAETPQDVLDRNRDLTIENAQLRASVEILRAQIRAVHSICYVLLFISALLAMSLVAYLIIDAQIKNAGLIQGGSLSALAWAFIVLIAAAVIFGGIAILRIVRRENKEAHSCSNV